MHPTLAEDEERALRQAAEQFRLTIEHAPIGMAVLALDGKFLRVNRALSEIVGYTEDELLARSLQEVTHPDDLSASLALVDRLVRGEIPRYRLGERCVRKDGSVADVVLHASVVRDELGSARHLIAQIEDTTDRKRFLERLYLTERLSTVGTLASGVAHEINNPLAYLISNLDVLADEVDRLPIPAEKVKDLRGLLRDASVGAERVRRVVRSLRAFSREEPERRRTVDLRRIAELSLAVAEGELRHRARVERNYGDVPVVLGDEQRLEQVFVHALLNASHALPDGRVDENFVRVTTRSDDVGRAVVEITDTGRGIPPEHMKRVFDPFFTTKPPGQGTGLGLSICHGIVTSFGGEIEIDSEVGKGTTLRLVFPPAPNEEPKAATPVPPPAAQTGVARVLVADDEAAIGRVIVRALRGHEVVRVASGREALDVLTKGDEHFDLVLCDLMMPEMTGMELHAELAKVQPAILPKMVFMTGGTFTPEGRAFLDTVPNEKMEKPFDLESLRSLVSRRIGGR